MTSQYFTVINKDGDTIGVWRRQGSMTVRVGVGDPMSASNTHVNINDGEELNVAMSRKLAAFFQHGSPCIVKEMVLRPGDYFKRMSRPSDQHPKDSPGSNPQVNLLESEIAVSRGQLVALIGRLEEIFQTVHPSMETYDCYGHEIRNLIILACTEVEAQWKGVLEVNNYMKPRYTTNDYVLLQPALRLGEYSVSLTNYPWLAASSPFLHWGVTGKPTQELEWYNAYNIVKHDREKNFKSAKLIHAIESVCACAIMLFAQYGYIEVVGFRSELANFFRIKKAPCWCPSEVYTYPYAEHANGYEAVNYPFYV